MFPALWMPASLIAIALEVSAKPESPLRKNDSIHIALEIVPMTADSSIVAAAVMDAKF